MIMRKKFLGTLLCALSIVSVMSTITVEQQTPSAMHGKSPYISAQEHIISQKQAKPLSVGQKEKNSDGAHLFGSLQRFGCSLGRYCKALISSIYGFAWGLEGGFKEHGKRRAVSGAVTAIVAAVAYNQYQATSPAEESEIKMEVEDANGIGVGNKPVELAQSNIGQAEDEQKNRVELVVGEFGGEEVIVPKVAVAPHVQGGQDGSDQPREGEKTLLGLSTAALNQPGKVVPKLLSAKKKHLSYRDKIRQYRENKKGNGAPNTLKAVALSLVNRRKAEGGDMQGGSNENPEQ